MAIARITVLTSGRGSNLRALLAAEQDGRLEGTIATVISNRVAIPALDVAAMHGVPTVVIPHVAYPERDAFDSALGAAIDASEPDLIVLAGFMRILGPELVGRYEGRMLNIHPSLLPSYPGLDTHRRALADGVRIHGCTVHFVTAALDHGPIVAQGAVAVNDGDDEASLAARVLAIEHRLLPAAVRAFCSGRLVIDGSRVHVKHERVPSAALEVPSPDS
jgi:phosphoribosylglycinamide formyltransferase-1